MQPALVLPFHDPEGVFLPHLQAILPDLKAAFGSAWLSVSGETCQRRPEAVRWLQAEPFFRVAFEDMQDPIGDRFAKLYAWAASGCPLAQVLHLCFIDRLAFALQTRHRRRFLADIRSTASLETPLIFQRSEKAWRTHPQNYRQIEGFVTIIGEGLFGRRLDYAWCHLALPAASLARVSPELKNHDLSLVAEIILHLQKDIQTREVDWLAWEDPFILGRDPRKLKAEREASPHETQKRLSYCLPMVETLMQFSLKKAG